VFDIIILLHNPSALESLADGQTFSFRIFLWGAEFMIPSIMIIHPVSEAAKRLPSLFLIDYHEH